MELSKVPPFSKGRLRLYIETNVRNIGIDVHAQGHQLLSADEVQKLLKAAQGIDYLFVQTGYLHATETGEKVAFGTKDGVIGHLRLENFGANPVALQVAAALKEIFRVTSYRDILGRHSIALETEGLQVRERAVADLSEQVKALGQYLGEISTREADARRKMDAELNAAYLDRTKELEAQYLQRQTDLEHQRTRTQEEHDKRVREFEEMRRTFEVREPKYIRRQLQGQLDEVLQQMEKLELSEETNKKRRPVQQTARGILQLSGFAAIALGSYILFAHMMPWVANIIRPGSIEDLPLLSVEWQVYVAFSLSVTTCVGTLIYVMKWHDRWFREHADVELNAKRYRADVLRAAWLAELFSELGEEKVSLPTEVVAAYTRNMFESTKSGPMPDHPMEHLTSMMKRATEMEIGGKNAALRVVASKSKDAD